MGLNIIISIFMFLIGSVFASFFGVVCCRVPQGLSISHPNSRCDNCGHELKWYENIPIFSYIFLKGKCKECKSKIGASGFIFEIIGGVVLVLAFLKTGINIRLAFVIPITLIMLLMAMYDYYTNTVLDIVWIIFLILVVAYKAYTILVLKESWLEVLLGGVICGGFFLLVKLIFYLIKKIDALGNGDIIVMAIAGLLLGVKTILFSILIASVVGSIIELIKLKITKEEKELPFLPYLTLGIFVSMLYGLELFNLLIGVI